MTMVTSTLQRSLTLPEAAVGVVQQRFALPELAQLATQIEVTTAGTPLRLDWPQISGATAVALDAARVTLVPPTGAAGISLGHLRGSFNADTCVVVIPGGPRVIRSLTMSGLRVGTGEDDALPNKAALRAQPVPLSLAVAVKQGGVLAPVGYAVPSIAPSPSQPPYVIPPLLVGASYRDYVLTLPDVLAEELHVMVVTGSAPEDFNPVNFQCDYVSAMAAPSPLDVTLADDSGAPFYSGAGPVTGPIAIDAKNAVQRALEAAIAAGNDPDVTLNISARTSGTVGTYGIVASGEVRRVFDDKISVTLEGERVMPMIPGAPLDVQVPTSATADVVIEHAGLRLQDLSDARPVGNGGQAGQVLTMDAPLWQPLPPEAMRGEVLRRVGIIGYGLEAATLSLRVLGASPDGRVIAPPDLATGTCDVAAPDLRAPQPPRVQWFDLGDGLTIDQPIGIEVTAQSGRFLWVAAADKLLSQYAVAHPLSGGETVTIGTQSVPITDARTALNGHALTPADFATAPQVTSPHFVTLTLSRLTLGYAP